jgi:hypothetical protein
MALAVKTQRRSEGILTGVDLTARKDFASVIREVRSYELEDPPRLHSGVCDSCAEAIFSRRAQVRESVAA